MCRTTSAETSSFHDCGNSMLAETRSCFHAVPQSPLCPGQYIDGGVRDKLRTVYGERIARMTEEYVR